MPAKKKKAKKPAKKKAAKKKVSAAKVKRGPAYECGVCGFRVVVDEACGCVEEHALICCNQPMAKK